MSALRGIVRLLRPTAHEIVLLARREVDPRQFAAFQPIHLGPFVSFIALLAIGLAGALVAPIRIVRRLLSRR